jgi:polysaccharide biosynthesis protein PslH
VGDQRPLILAVSSQAPWPLDRGGHLRTFHLLRALARRFRVRLVAGVAAADGAIGGALRDAGIDFAPVVLGARHPVAEARRIIAARLHGEPYVCYRRHDRPAMHERVRQALRDDRPSVLYLDHLDSFLFASLNNGIPSAIDCHNVYSSLVQRTALDERRPTRRWFLEGEATRLAALERRASQSADAILTVSDLERDYYASLGARRTFVVPNGVDCSQFDTLPTGRAGSPPVILYIGMMSWPPNARAASFLATSVLPLLRQRIPDVRLRIVGRDPAPDVWRLRELPGVDVLGAVPDVMPHLQAARVLAVPLDAGGGTRLKILEAFAAGLPVVSTPIGCEGLSVAADRHLVIADRDDFAGALLSVLLDEARAALLAQRARRLVQDLYDWRAVGERACESIEQLLASSRAS